MSTHNSTRTVTQAQDQSWDPGAILPAVPLCCPEPIFIWLNGHCGCRGSCKPIKSHTQIHQIILEFHLDNQLLLMLGQNENLWSYVSKIAHPWVFLFCFLLFFLVSISVKSLHHGAVNHLLDLPT